MTLSQKILILNNFKLSVEIRILSNYEFVKWNSTYNICGFMEELQTQTRNAVVVESDRLGEVHRSS